MIQFEAYCIMFFRKRQPCGDYLPCWTWRNCWWSRVLPYYVWCPNKRRAARAWGMDFQLCDTASKRKNTALALRWCSLSEHIQMCFIAVIKKAVELGKYTAFHICWGLGVMAVWKSDRLKSGQSNAVSIFLLLVLPPMKRKELPETQNQIHFCHLLNMAPPKKKLFLYVKRLLCFPLHIQVAQSGLAVGFAIIRGLVNYTVCEVNTLHYGKSY